MPVRACGIALFQQAVDRASQVGQHFGGSQQVLVVADPQRGPVDELCDKGPRPYPLHICTVDMLLRTSVYHHSI